MATYINKFISLNHLRKANQELFKHSSVGMAANECVVSNPYLTYKWEHINPADYQVTKSFVNPNGHVIPYIREVRKHIRLPIPANIITHQEKRNYWSIYTADTPYISLKDKLESSRAVDVFVNRIRVDRDLAYITVYDGSLDLYIPKEYFDFNSSENFLWLYVYQYTTGEVFREYTTDMSPMDDIFDDWENDDKSIDPITGEAYYIPRKMDSNVFDLFDILSERTEYYRDLIETQFSEEMYPEGYTVMIDCNSVLDSLNTDQLTSSVVDARVFNGDLYSTYVPANLTHVRNVMNIHRSMNPDIHESIINNEFDNKEYYSHDIGMYLHHAEYKYGANPTILSDTDDSSDQSD